MRQVAWGRGQFLKAEAKMLALRPMQKIEAEAIVMRLSQGQSGLEAMTSLFPITVS